MRIRRRTVRGGGPIGDFFSGAYRSVKNALGFQTNPEYTQLPGAMDPYQGADVQNPMQQQQQLQQPQNVGGRRRVRMRGKSRSRGRYRLFSGGSNVTPYSSDIWSAQGAYPKSVGGRRKKRRKYKTRKHK